MTFLEIAHQGSFVKGANRLGLSSSAASKAVAKLEDELGVKLLQRTTRNVVLTAEGQQFAEGFGRLNQELNALTDELQGHQKSPHGPLHVSVPPVFGRNVLMRLIPAFVHKYPDIALEVSFDAGAVNLAADKVDLAIRAGALPESANLVARKLTEVRRLTCCHASTLSDVSAMQHPDELADLPLLTTRSTSTGKLAPLTFQEHGNPFSLVPRRALVLNDADAIFTACQQGLGVAQVFDFQLSTTNEELHAVLSDFAPPAIPLYALYLDRHLVSSRIRVFIDFLVAGLQTEASV